MLVSIIITLVISIVAALFSCFLTFTRRKKTFTRRLSDFQANPSAHNKRRLSLEASSPPIKPSDAPSHPIEHSESQAGAKAGAKTGAESPISPLPEHPTDPADEPSSLSLNSSAFGLNSDGGLPSAATNASKAAGLDAKASQTKTTDSARDYESDSDSDSSDYDAGAGDDEIDPSIGAKDKGYGAVARRLSRRLSQTLGMLPSVAKDAIQKNYYLDPVYKEKGRYIEQGLEGAAAVADGIKHDIERVGQAAANAVGNDPRYQLLLKQSEDLFRQLMFLLKQLDQAYNLSLAMEDVKDGINDAVNLGKGVVQNAGSDLEKLHRRNLKLIDQISTAIQSNAVLKQGGVAGAAGLSIPGITKSLSEFAEASESVYAKSRSLLNMDEDDMDIRKKYGIGQFDATENVEDSDDEDEEVTGMTLDQFADDIVKLKDWRYYRDFFYGSYVPVVTYAIVLYSAGCVHYCLTFESNLNVYYYFYGIFTVLLIFSMTQFFYTFGVKFTKSMKLRYKSVTKIGILLGLVLTLVTAAVISDLILIDNAEEQGAKVMAGFLLLVAAILSFQYSHWPLNASKNGLSETWICLVCNLIVPLFGYYLQLDLLVASRQIANIAVLDSVILGNDLLLNSSSASIVVDAGGAQSVVAGADEGVIAIDAAVLDAVDEVDIGDISGITDISDISAITTIAVDAEGSEGSEGSEATGEGEEGAGSSIVAGLIERAALRLKDVCGNYQFEETNFANPENVSATLNSIESAEEFLCFVATMQEFEVKMDASPLILAATQSAFGRFGQGQFKFDFELSDALKEQLRQFSQYYEVSYEFVNQTQRRITERASEFVNSAKEMFGKAADTLSDRVSTGLDRLESVEPGTLVNEMRQGVEQRLEQGIQQGREQVQQLQQNLEQGLEQGLQGLRRLNGNMRQRYGFDETMGKLLELARYGELSDLPTIRDSMQLIFKLPSNISENEYFNDLVTNIQSNVENIQTEVQQNVQTLQNRVETIGQDGAQRLRQLGRTLRDTYEEQKERGVDAISTNIPKLSVLWSRFPSRFESGLVDMKEILSIPFENDLKTIVKDAVLDMAYNAYDNVFGKRYYYLLGRGGDDSIEATESTNKPNIGGLNPPQRRIKGADRVAVDDTPYSVWDVFKQFFPSKLFNIIMVSWFVTHATMLLSTSFVVKKNGSSNSQRPHSTRRNALGGTVNVLLKGSLGERLGYKNLRTLFCCELALSYLLAFLFWKNNLLMLNYFNFDEDHEVLLRIGRFELTYSQMSYYSSNMVFYLIVATVPWAVGLVRHIWGSNLKFDEYGYITSMSMKTKSPLLRARFSNSNAYHALMFNCFWLFGVYFGQLLDVLLFFEKSGEIGFISLALLWSDPYTCIGNAMVLAVPLWMLSFVWLPIIEEFVWATGL